MTIRRLDIDEHFIIPEGYIDSFCEEIMGKLPEQPYQPRNIKQRKRKHPYYAAAAAIATLIITIGTVSFFNNNASNSEEETAATESYSVEDAADYAMIDRMKMYEMITE